MASQRAVTNRTRHEPGFERARKELFDEGISSSRMYIDTERPGDPLAFGRAGGPASTENRLDTRQRETGSFGDILDRQRALIEQEINRFHSSNHPRESRIRT